MALFFYFTVKQIPSPSQIHSLSSLSQKHYFSKALHTVKSIIVKAKLLPKKPSAKKYISVK